MIADLRERDADEIGRAVDGNIMNFSELLQDITLQGTVVDGIDTPISDAPAAVYTLDGRRTPSAATTTSASQHGVSILRSADGTVRKVIR